MKNSELLSSNFYSLPLVLIVFFNNYKTYHLLGGKGTIIQHGTKYNLKNNNKKHKLLNINNRFSRNLKVKTKAQDNLPRGRDHNQWH